MGRLIDADNLLFILNSVIELRKKSQRNTSDLDMMADYVNDEPTAYDPEKVVKQLEERSKEYNSGVRLHGKPEKMLTDDAIEIVKGGGVDGN